MTEKSWWYENVYCLWAIAHDRYSKNEIYGGDHKRLFEKVFIRNNNTSRGPSDSPVTRSRRSREPWGELRKCWPSRPRSLPWPRAGSISSRPGCCSCWVGFAGLLAFLPEARLPSPSLALPERGTQPVGLGCPLLRAPSALPLCPACCRGPGDHVYLSTSL